MGVVGRLDQYASMLATEFDDYSMSENLVSYSTYTASNWINNFPAGASITTGITAPDGTNTAVRLTCTNTTNALLRVTIPSLTPNGTDTYTTSFYVRKISGTGGAFTDLGDGNPSADYSSQLVTNQWVRVTVSGVPTATAKTFLDLFSDNNTNYVLDFWGVQLEKSSVATDYTPTLGTIISRVLASTTNTNITGLGTYYSSGFDENVGFTTFLPANIFAPYDPVYDEFGGTFFGAGQGRYMRQNTDKSVIVYNEIDEISDFRDIVKIGLVLDLDAGMNASYNGSGTTWTDLSGISTSIVGVGQSGFTTAGTFTFTVPTQVTSISGVVVGGGGGGAGADSRNGDGMGGGGGGALCYGTISVTPGEILSVTVGTGGNGGGSGGAAGSTGGLSRISRGATNLLTANGGNNGAYRSTAATAQSTFSADASVTSSGGGNGGGAGGSPTNGGSGGGGAGGYGGAGGTGGGTAAPTAGSNGGGGGGGNITSGGNARAWGGGGTGILGSGANGTVGTNGSTAGGGGSGGATGSNGTPNTGTYGGGGGAADTDGTFAGATGASGAVRIIWGTDRSYPSTTVSDQTTVVGVATTSNNAQLVNAPTYSSANGGYFVFNGTNQYVTSSFNTTSGQAVTYAGWLYSTETTATYRNFVDSLTVNPMIWWNTSGQIEFDAALYTTPAVYRNQWVYVALSKPSGSSSPSYYVNGVLVGSGSAYTTPAVPPTWFNRAGAQTWKGNASNVQAYNRALSAAEILQNYNALKHRFGL